MSATAESAGGRLRNERRSLEAGADRLRHESPHSPYESLSKTMFRFQDDEPLNVLIQLTSANDMNRGWRIHRNLIVISIFGSSPS